MENFLKRKHCKSTTREFPKRFFSDDANRNPTFVSLPATHASAHTRICATHAVTLVVSIDEEFFGECDIVVDTHKDGTLKELVDVVMRASDGTGDVGTGVTRLRFDASLE